MKVLVTVKQVATLDDRLDVERAEWDLNSWDAHAAEAALELGDEVVAVTVGGEQAREALLTVLAMGADRAVHITHDGPLDPLATARLLAPVVQREAPDLVLCGAHSADALNGATGVALAALAGLPRMAAVKAIEVADGAATVVREVEGGLVERLRVKLPALFTVQANINEPRYATLRGIRKAASKPLEVIAAEDIRPGAHVVATTVPPKGEGAEMLTGSAGEVAARIATIIKSKVAG